MDQIKQVAIVGGVHGNEFSGIYLVKQYQQQPEQVSRRSFTTETVWANPEAHYANKRYLHSDLNRQFKTVDLANPNLCNYEQSRAKVLTDTDTTTWLEPEIAALRERVREVPANGKRRHRGA